MRLSSTPRSAANGEITKLACVECLIAIALYVGIGVWTGSFRHVTVAIAVAPLMLLRTDASARWGLSTYSNCLGWLDRFAGPGAAFLAMISAPVIGVTLRVVSTTYWALRLPIQALKAIPYNWVRQTLCTDFLHPPEIMPLEALEGDLTQIPTFAELIDVFRAEKRGWRVLVVLVASPILLVGYIPSLVYRVSFKATAIAYAPLVWVAHTTMESPLSVKGRLERITKGELEKVRRGLSWLVVSTLALKVGVMAGWLDMSYVVSKFPNPALADRLVVPNEWPLWQMALGADAALTFFLLYFADAALARREDARPWSETMVVNTVSTATFVRGALGIVAVVRASGVAIEASLGSLF